MLRATRLARNVLVEHIRALVLQPTIQMGLELRCASEASEGAFPVEDPFIFMQHVAKIAWGLC